MFICYININYILWTHVTALILHNITVACASTKDAAIIDAGDDPKPFIDYATSRGWNIKHILQTHGHFDHVAGLKDTKDALPDALIYLHPKERVCFPSGCCVIGKRAYPYPYDD